MYGGSRSRQSRAPVLAGTPGKARGFRRFAVSRRPSPRRRLTAERSRIPPIHRCGLPPSRGGFCAVASPRRGCGQPSCSVRFFVPTLRHKARVRHWGRCARTACLDARRVRPAPAWKRGSQPLTPLRVGQLLHPVAVPSRAVRLRVLPRPELLRHERPPVERLPAGPLPVARPAGARLPVARPLDAPPLLEPPAAAPFVGARSPSAHSRSAALLGERPLVEPTPVVRSVGAQPPLLHSRRAALPGEPHPVALSAGAPLPALQSRFAVLPDGRLPRVRLAGAEPAVAQSLAARSRYAELPGEQPLFSPPPVARPLGARPPASRSRGALLPSGPPPCVHSRASRHPTTEPAVGPPGPDDRRQPAPWPRLAFLRPLLLATMQRLPDSMPQMPRPMRASARRQQGPPPTWVRRFAPPRSRLAPRERRARPRWVLQRATQPQQARQVTLRPFLVAARGRVCARGSIRPPRSTRSHQELRRPLRPGVLCPLRGCQQWGPRPAAAGSMSPARARWPRPPLPLQHFREQLSARRAGQAPRRAAVAMETRSPEDPTPDRRRSGSTTPRGSAARGPAPMSATVASR